MEKERVTGWIRSFQVKNTMCKGPGVGESMVHLRSYKWVRVPRPQKSRRQMFCEVNSRVGRTHNDDHRTSKIK